MFNRVCCGRRLYPPHIVVSRTHLLDGVGHCVRVSLRICCSTNQQPTYRWGFGVCFGVWGGSGAYGILFGLLVSRRPVAAKRDGNLLVLYKRTKNNNAVGAVKRRCDDLDCRGLYAHIHTHKICVRNVAYARTRNVPQRINNNDKKRGAEVTDEIECVSNPIDAIRGDGVRIEKAVWRCRGGAGCAWSPGYIRNSDHGIRRWRNQTTSDKN